MVRKHQSGLIIISSKSIFPMTAPNNNRTHSGVQAPQAMTRAFKGIWIPAEIWLNPELSITEKVMLVEIESLQDPVRGCYASNAHFAAFFGLSISRVSEIISSLKAKGMISVFLVKAGKQITERQLRISTSFEKPNTPSEKPNTPSENENTPIRKTEYPPSENTKGSNTKSNNTNSSNTDKSVGAEAPPAQVKPVNHAFETAWKHYPKREGSNPKNKALQAWNARIAEGVTPEEIMGGLVRYIGFCDAKGQTGSPFVMQAARFFGPGREFENEWSVSDAPVRKGAPRNTDDDTSWILDMENVL